MFNETGEQTNIYVTNWTHIEWQKETRFHHNYFDVYKALIFVYFYIYCLVVILHYNYIRILLSIRVECEQ